MSQNRTWVKSTKQYLDLLFDGNSKGGNYNHPNFYYYRNGELFGRYNHMEGKYYMLSDKYKDFMEVAELEIKKLDVLNQKITKARSEYMKIKNRFPDLQARFTDTSTNDYTVTYSSKMVRNDWSKVEFRQYFADFYTEVRNIKVYADYMIVFGDDPNWEGYRNETIKLFGEKAYELIKEEIIRRNKSEML